jgi:hypothetical protein
VPRFSLGLSASSTCALRIEGNDQPETRCRTEGIDRRPVFLPEFLQPARLALSFSATSIASPIVALISSRINPVLLRIRRSNVLPLDLETDLDGYLEFVHSAGDDATPFLNDLKPIHVTDGF